MDRVATVVRSNASLHKKMTLAKAQSARRRETIDLSACAVLRQLPRDKRDDKAWAQGGADSVYFSLSWRS